MRFPKHKGTHSVLLWRTLLFIFLFFFYHAGFKPLDIGQFLGQKPTETSNEKKKNFWVCTMKTVWCATGVLALGVVWENNGSRVCEKVQTVSAVCAFFCLGCFSQCLWLLSRSHRQCHIIPSFQQRHTDLYGRSRTGQCPTMPILWQKKDKLHTSCCTEHLCVIPETGKIETGKIDFKHFS